MYLLLIYKVSRELKLSDISKVEWMFNVAENVSTLSASTFKLFFSTVVLAESSSLIIMDHKGAVSAAFVWLSLKLDVHLLVKSTYMHQNICLSTTRTNTHPAVTLLLSTAHFSIIGL